MTLLNYYNSGVHVLCSCMTLLSPSKRMSDGRRPTKH